MNFKSIALAVSILVISTSTNAAPIYTYVGSWHVGEGPEFFTNPDVLSGQETAALLFGGGASNYAISTISADPNSINFLTYLDGWANRTHLVTPAAQDFKVDIGTSGYSEAGDFSAYVRDHSCYQQSPCLDNYINYAFTVVPIPAAVWLFGSGLLGLIGVARRKTA